VAVIETDVLIVGAGPAGAATALFLAKKNISSVLVDKAFFPRDKICGDALSGKVVEVLNKLDKNFAHELNCNEKFIGSWGVTFVAPNNESLRVPFSTKKEAGIAPGFISKRIDFDNWLVQKIKLNPLVQLLEQTEIRNYRMEKDFVVAETTDGKIFHSKLVVACDGAHSVFSKNVAGLVTEPQHNCFGLRAYYKNVKGLDKENFIELHFLNEILPGYFWIFPLPNGEANVGIGMRADKLAEKKINLKKAFEKIVAENKTIHERFSEATLAGDIKLYGLPLGSRKRKISGERFLLCGDAAQLIDPFTGEGIGNAMQSGMYAAMQVERCLTLNNFSEKFMQQYDTELYKRLGDELQLSYRMQQLVSYPSLFNFVVKKANSNKILRETISCMFEDLDMRARLKNPFFYLRLLFS
jgi:geranylgeranyl reductase family protein